MTGRPAAFLDRDGVLIEDSGYPHRPEDLKLIPGAAAAVRRMKDAGYRTVIVTNQSGVARGLFSEERMHAFNAELVARLAQDGAALHHPHRQGTPRLHREAPEDEASHRFDGTADMVLLARAHAAGCQ